jgi:peroxiredoxin
MGNADKIGVSSLQGEPVLTVGDKFPEFELTACVSLEKGKEFEKINHKTYEGKWKVIFAWPKDFTFVCPTEIAAFGKLNDEFADRDAQILGFSGDSEFVHHAWRKDHPDLTDLPFPMMADSKHELMRELGIEDEEGFAKRGEAHQPPRPLDQGDAEQRFEIAKPGRQRRLGDEAGFRGLPEMLVPPQRDEILELFQAGQID